MTTEKNRSVLSKLAPVVMFVAPLAVGAAIAIAFGFTNPASVNADGIDWNSYPTTYDSGSDWYSYPTSYDTGSDWYSYPTTYDTGSDWYSYPTTYDTGTDWNSYPTDYTYGVYDVYQPQYYSTTPAPDYSYVDCSLTYGCGSYYYPQQPVYNYQQPVSYQQPSSSYYQYDYSYDSYEYEYTYEYDYCTNIPGIQKSSKDCEKEKPHDECSNIKGNQPKGYDCYPDEDENDLRCELDASESRVDEGDEVTLEWDIDGDANYASINHGVGRVDEDGGEEDVEVDEDTTFRLTVRDRHGNEDTCSVTVRVDEENNFSSIDFEGEPTNNPPQVVYLSSIPYTGLEDIDPALLSYWLMLIAGAGMLGWFLVRNGFVPTFAFATNEPTVEDTTEEAPVSDVPATENAFVSALENGNTDAAIDGLRDAVAHGASIEDTLEAAAEAAKGTALESRINAALEASRINGIRGVKATLA